MFKLIRYYHFLYNRQRGNVRGNLSVKILLYFITSRYYEGYESKAWRQHLQCIGVKALACYVIIHDVPHRILSI